MKPFLALTLLSLFSWTTQAAVIEATISVPQDDLATLNIKLDAAEIQTRYEVDGTFKKGNQNQIRTYGSIRVLKKTGNQTVNLENDLVLSRSPKEKTVIATGSLAGLPLRGSLELERNTLMDTNREIRLVDLHVANVRAQGLARSGALGIEVSALSSSNADGRVFQFGPFQVMGAAQGQLGPKSSIAIASVNLNQEALRSGQIVPRSSMASLQFLFGTLVVGGHALCEQRAQLSGQQLLKTRGTLCRLRLVVSPVEANQKMEARTLEGLLAFVQLILPQSFILSEESVWL